MRRVRAARKIGWSKFFESCQKVYRINAEAQGSQLDIRLDIRLIAVATKVRMQVSASANKGLKPLVLR